MKQAIYTITNPNYSLLEEQNYIGLKNVNWKKSIVTAGLITAILVASSNIGDLIRCGRETPRGRVEIVKLE